MPKRVKESAPIEASAIQWAVSFVDRFEDPTEKFATLHEMEKQPNGVMTFPWYEYSPVVGEFIKGLYDRKLILEFDWGKWKRGEQLFANPGLIDHATDTDCLKLITMCDRQNRTYEGFLAKAFENGVITACLKRLRDLYPSR